MSFASSSLATATVRKPLRDLLRAKVSTTLVVIAMTAILAAATAFAVATPILQRETARSYLDTSPPHLVLRLSEKLDEPSANAAAAILKGIEGVRFAEPERQVQGRVQAQVQGRAQGGRWKTLLLKVWPSGDSGVIARVNLEPGTSSPAVGEILIERSSLSLLQFDIGDQLRVQVGDGESTDLRLAGLVHDGSQAPGWMEDLVYGFVRPETLGRLGVGASFDRLAILAEAASSDPTALQALAESAKTRLGSLGVAVTRVDYPPRRHPHQSQVDALIWTLVVLGGLITILGGILVSTVIATLMARQTRSIAVMKALGAGRRQALALSLPLILIPALVAVPLGLALGIPLGRAYAAFAAGILNAEVIDWRLDGWLLVGLLLLALLAVLLAGLGPIWRVSRLTVREGLDESAGATRFGQRLGDRLTAPLGRLGSSLALAVRNLFRTPRRTVPTLLLLSLAGALFTTSLNVGRSWTRTIEAENSRSGHELEIQFSSPQDAIETRRLLQGTELIERVELRQVTYVQAAGGSRDAKEAREVRDEDDDFPVIAFDPRDPIVDQDVIAGRWLTPEDSSEVVLNQHLARSLGAEVGMNITLRKDGVATDWQVVGIVRELLGEVAYTNPRTLTQLRADAGIDLALVALTPEASVDSWTAAQTLEESLADAGLPIRRVRFTQSRHGSLRAHVVIFVRTSLLVAALLACVAAFGLASALALAVVERTQELAVLRALGAGRRRIGTLILGEALCLVSASFLLATLISIPLTLVVNQSSGQIFLERPLAFAASPLGYFAWLLGLAAVAWIAGALPARRAMKPVLAEVLTAG